MAGKANILQSDVLKLIFQATGIAIVADNTATAPLTNLFVSLHTADPTNGGTQSSTEATYTGYARVAVARSTTGWTISGSSPTGVSNAATVSFPACTGGSSTVTFVGIGTTVSGTGKLLYSGAITSPSGGLAISNGITPSFAAGQVTVTED